MKDKNLDVMDAWVDDGGDDEGEVEDDSPDQCRINYSLSLTPPTHPH